MTEYTNSLAKFLFLNRNGIVSSAPQFGQYWNPDELEVSDERVSSEARQNLPLKSRL